MKKLLANLATTAAVTVGLVATPLSWAKVSPEQAARLERDLTPVGAERIGNADGSIPAWEGGLQSPPPGYDPEKWHINPYSSDTAVLTINASNFSAHKDLLSEGHRAMFATYPDSYVMKIYPTRRSASYPKKVYEALKYNATNATLQERGTGVRNSRMTSPFPIPQSGVEIIWNHILRYRGQEAAFRSSFGIVESSGAYSLVTLDYSYLFVYAQPDVDMAKIENKIFYLKTDVIAPPKLAGTMNLVHETLDQVRSPRQAWRYEAGQRRLRRAPQMDYEAEVPNSNGTRTVDQVDMYNGAPDQYEWDLIGKQELYVPYNAYSLNAGGVKPEEIIRPGHINQDLARYERHRVWVVEGRLRVGLSHLYHKRRMYFDEDSWHILLTEDYDDDNRLWRVSEAHTINYYQEPAIWTTLETTYDIQNRRYMVDGLDNEEDARDFNPDFSEGDFSPATVRREARR